MSANSQLQGTTDKLGFVGQVVDVYEFDGALQVTLWSPGEARKRTVGLRGVAETLRIGDVIAIHGGVGSDATVFGANDVPAAFEPPLGLPTRAQTVELAPPVAS